MKQILQRARAIAGVIGLLFAFASPALASQGSGCLPTTGIESGLVLTNNINTGLAALISSNSGTTAPHTDCSGVAVAGQIWVNTSANPFNISYFDGTSWVSIGTIDTVAHAFTPSSALLNADIGVVKAFAGTVAPSNHFMAFGQCVSKVIYANLYAVIGDTWTVNDGCTAGNFGIPDLRGRAIAGVDNMGGTAANRLTATTIPGGALLGMAGGAETVILSQAQMPSHTHTATATVPPISISDPGHAHAYNVATQGLALAGGIGVTWDTGLASATTVGSFTGITQTNSGTANVTNANTGSGGSHSSVQPTIPLNYIIRY